jgi:hypothetical protein
VGFFTVPTVMFKVLFVFVVPAPERRRVVHINVTDAPTAQWTGQQLVEAFPWQTAPRYLLRDRDAVYGVAFSRRAQSMGLHEVTTAPRSPWQNPYVERLIGTLRRECLDHVVVLHVGGSGRRTPCSEWAFAPPTFYADSRPRRRGGRHGHYDG